jgi:hypothetical protein
MKMVTETETDIPAEGAEGAAAEEAAVEAPVGVTDPEAIIGFIDENVAAILAMDKKSNYHNARRSAFMQVRNLIAPPPPKPKKEKKSKAKSAAAAGTDVNTGEATEGVAGVDVPAEGDTGAA